MAREHSYLSVDSPDTPAATDSGGFWSDCWKVVVIVLAPLASLKITVVLFLMAIFIVFAGTLAQTEKDLGQVIHEYFRMDLSSIESALRTSFSWIDFRIFFPRPFFPNMEPIPWGWGFPFPNGWLIGLGLFINLTAAHLIRFRIQTRGSRLLTGLVIIGGGCFLTCLVIMAGSLQSADRPEIFTQWPSLRILWLLIQCTLASVVLLLGCTFVFRKRCGVVLLHAGVGLLMFGELLVGVAAVESQMQIIEGQTVNYLMEPDKLELVLIDSSNEEEDEVFAIPQTRLSKGDIISDDVLPVDVELVKYMANSQLRSATSEDEDTNRATAGSGLVRIADEVKPVSSADMSERGNRPTAYARFIDKDSGKSLGVYRLGLIDWMSGRAETLQVGNRTFAVNLRYKHHYTPYSMHLINVEQKTYMGTQTAKSYASEIMLSDPKRKVKRKVRIWMNNPLRYAGATFYQSSYGVDPMSRKEYTGLQVVTNTGWRIPYVSCMMVVVGMLAQFWIALNRYLKRRADGRLAGRSSRDPVVAPAGQVPGKAPSLRPKQDLWTWLVPLGIVCLCAIWLLSKTREPEVPPSNVDYAAFGRLPVVHEGRIKPFDSLARSCLRKVSDRSYYVDAAGNRQPAIRWLLDVITDSDAARKHEVIRIHNLEVLETLGLERRKYFRYAVDEFKDKLVEFDEQVRKSRSMDPEERDLYARKILDLEKRLNEYRMLQEAFRPTRLNRGSTREDVTSEINRIDRLSNYPLPLAVPPVDEQQEWKAYTFASFAAFAQEIAASQGDQRIEPNKAAGAMKDILEAYNRRAESASTFNVSVQEYEELLAENPPVNWAPEKDDFETFFNRTAPLYHAMILYGLAFVLGVCAWIGWSGPLQRAATWLCLFTLAVHTLALAGRIYISGRPPITTLYTSTLTVGWVCVAIGLLMERYSRVGVANVVAALTGFLGLLLGYALTTKVDGFKGDSFTVLVAVLDTNFWLALHVVTVAAGYSATFFAGFMGAMYVFRGLFTSSLTPQLGKEVARMIYGTVCFAIFFSFFGTVLGGLWADDSWGRFWGWDPKENGALMIVLWNAVVLHALWGRMVGDRGLAVLVILGNIVTAWSWFGVNELQVGLHSYGFTEGVLLFLAGWAGLNLVLFCCGMVPRDIWRSRPSRGVVDAKLVD